MLLLWKPPDGSVLLWKILSACSLLPAFPFIRARVRLTTGRGDGKQGVRCVSE